MNDKLSDDDIIALIHTKLPRYKDSLITFLRDLPKINLVDAIKKKECVDVIYVYISCLDHTNSCFRFYSEAEFEAFKKILLSECSYLHIVYTSDDRSLFSSYIDNGVPLYMLDDMVRITWIIYQDSIADDDEKWNSFYKSHYDDYMLLLSMYLNENARFIESINKRLEAASDSDKLLAMIGDK